MEVAGAVARLKTNTTYFVFHHLALNFPGTYDFEIVVTHRAIVRSGKRALIACVLYQRHLKSFSLKSQVGKCSQLGGTQLSDFKVF